MNQETIFYQEMGVCDCTSNYSKLFSLMYVYYKLCMVDSLTLPYLQDSKSKRGNVCSPYMQHVLSQQNPMDLVVSNSTVLLVP